MYSLLFVVSFIGFCGWNFVCFKAKKMVRTKAKPRKNTDQSGATKRRPRRGKKVLKKIQQYQASTALSIPPLDFVRFLRKISTDKYPDIKCKVEAAMALQVSCYTIIHIVVVRTSKNIYTI